MPLSEKDIKDGNAALDTVLEESKELNKLGYERTAKALKALAGIVAMLLKGE